MSALIASIRVTHHDAPPFVVPVADSTLGPFERFSPSILRIRTSDGAEGIALTGHVESRVIRMYIAPILLRQRLAAWPELREQTFWALRNLGHGGPSMSALSSVDWAIHDLLGQYDNTPLWRRFGPGRDAIEAYGSGGWTSLSDDEVTRSMVGLVERGFTTVKMRIGIDRGRQPRRDVERVRAVRDAIGPDIALAVDANQCWDAPTAIDVAHRIAEYRVAWFEEPVFAFDRQAAAAFRRESPILLAAGESERLPHGFRDLITAGAVSILQPQPLCCGGVTGWREAAELARGAGLPLDAAGPGLVTAPLVAGCPWSGRCEYLVPQMDALAAYFREAPRLQESTLVLSDAPGNGLRLDEEFLRTHPGLPGWERPL